MSCPFNGAPALYFRSASTIVPESRDVLGRSIAARTYNAHVEDLTQPEVSGVTSTLSRLTGGSRKGKGGLLGGLLIPGIL